MSADQIEEQQHTVPPLTPVVRGLLVANAAALFLQLTIANPTGVARLFGFTAASVPDRWWTAATYMFVHAGAWHLLANAYALWIFGPRLEHEWGTKRFGWFYLFCALCAVVVQSLFVRQGILSGSSAPILGVMVAYAMQWPNDEFSILSIPVRVWTLVTVFVGLNLALGLSATAPDGAAVNLAYLAHIGGMVGGWIYMRTPTGSMDNVRQRVAQLPEPGEPPRAIPKNGPRKERGDEVDEIVAKSKAVMSKRSPTLTQPRARRESRPEELNRVLDKISKHGLDSLSADERKLLEEASKRLRDR